eukprot:scaffold8.g1535.t1
MAQPAARSARPSFSVWRPSRPAAHLARVHAHHRGGWQQDEAPQDASRRAALAAAAALVSLLSLRGSAWADSEVPKAYQDTARKLVHVLQESITKDLSGADEREIRKAAEPAQDLVRAVMSRWRGQPAVAADESFRQLTAGIAELGEFYRRKGARARMSEEVGNSILAKLAAAEEALPPEPEGGSKLPFMF